VCKSRSSSTRRCSRRCVALHGVALRCGALRCVALRCVALCCVAGRYSALQCAAVRCRALMCVAVRCSVLLLCVLQCVAVRCSWNTRRCSEMYQRHAFQGSPPQSPGQGHRCQGEPDTKTAHPTMRRSPHTARTSLDFRATPLLCHSDHAAAHAHCPAGEDS